LVQKILKIQGVDLPMEVYFGTFPTNDFNANARRTANGALCLLNQGLTAFLYHFSVACCYPIETTAAAGKGATVRIPERFLYSEMPKLQEAFGGALLTAYYYLTRSQHEYPTTFSDSYDPFGFATANLLTYAMRAFVVAHELSHVLLGHVDDSAASVRSAVTPVGEVTVLSRNQQQEFEADVMAQRILMAADRLLPNSGLYASGGICFLATHLFVQQLAAKMFDVPFDERSPTNSHPPARDRISNLLGRLREEADKDVYARSFQLFRLLIKYSSELGRAEVAALHSGEGVKLSFKIPPDEDK
jgi:hypothetical protein